MQRLGDFCRRGKIHSRQLIVGYILKLNETEYSLFPVRCKPLFNSLMVVTALFIILR